MPGQLFTQYFLTDGIEATPEWKASVDHPDDFESFKVAVKELFRMSFYSIIDPGIYRVIDPPWELGVLSNIRYWPGGQSPPLSRRSFRWGDSFSR